MICGSGTKRQQLIRDHSLSLAIPRFDLELEQKLILCPQGQRVKSHNTTQHTSMLRMIQRGESSQSSQLVHYLSPNIYIQDLGPEQRSSLPCSAVQFMNNSVWLPSQSIRLSKRVNITTLQRLRGLSLTRKPASK